MGRIWKLLSTPLTRARAPRNVCCRCAYDLSALAESPPAPSAPSLCCPECGASVALRERWWTDGSRSMSKLMAMSAVVALSALTLMLLVSVDIGLLQHIRTSARTLPLPLEILAVLLVAALPFLTLTGAGPYAFCFLATRGTTHPRHADKRALAISAPFAIGFVLYMFIGSRLIL